MFWMLAWVACVGGSGEKADKAVVAPPDDPQEASRTAPVALPPGAAIARSCFDDVEREAKKLSAPNKAPVPPPVRSGATRMRNKPDAAPSGAAPAPSATTVEVIASSDRETVTYPEGKTVARDAVGRLDSQGDRKPTEGGSGAGGRANADPSASSGVLGGVYGSSGASTEESAKPQGQPMATSTPKTASTKDEAAAEPVGAKGKAGPLADKRTVSGRKEARELMERRPVAPPKPPEPQIDWGGTTWLSNDDSMSLASAQRVLFDVKEHVDFQPSEVRPHELLNYFSFETAPIEDGSLFSVKPSATRVGETKLALALAVQGAMPARQPLDLTLVVDVSGSMWAEGRMDYVKRGLGRMSEQLERGDRVNLVIFDHQVCTPLEDYVVGRDSASMLSDAIASLEPRGSTDMNAGLQEGYRLADRFAAQDSSRQRNDRVMVLTDALLNTGDINPDTVSEIGRAYENSGVRLTGVGVGREFNDTVLDKLTEKGKGAYVYLGSEAVVDRIMGVGFRSLTQTIAHDVRFELDLPDSLGMARFYGEEASSDPEDIQPINYYAGTRQLFLQDLHIREGRVVGSDPITLTIHFSDAATGEIKTQRYTTTVGEALAADTHNVDKARALMGWTDFLLARAMHGEPCGSPLSEYRSRAGELSDDAEIAYVNSLTGPLCGVDMGSTPSAGVAWRVRVDSDVPIAEVALSCPSGGQRQTLSGSDTIARFNATPGSCTLTLEGAVPLIAKVNVPATGGEARCLVRGGRLSCS